MGKPTGFLDYERKNAKAEAPLERIKHFNEFHTPLSREEQEKQGARCMACGVPFCQAGQMLGGMMSGCPLQNWCLNGMIWYIWATGGSVLPSVQYQQLPGVHRPCVSGTLRGCLYL